MARLIEFGYRPGAGADALAMTVGAKRLRLHSYYFAIDGSKDEDNVRASLSALLLQWHQALAEAKSGDTIYLPYDFEDEFTRWLRCRFTLDDCTIHAGWSPVEGARIKPSKWAPGRGSVLEFERLKNVPTVQAKRGRLLADIEAARAALEKAGRTELF